MDSKDKIPKTVDVYDDRQSNTKGNDDLTNLSKNLKATFNHKVSIKARGSVYLSIFYLKDSKLKS